MSVMDDRDPVILIWIESASSVCLKLIFKSLHIICFSICLWLLFVNEMYVKDFVCRDIHGHYGRDEHVKSS